MDAQKSCLPWFSKSQSGPQGQEKDPNPVWDADPHPHPKLLYTQVRPPVLMERLQSKETARQVPSSKIPLACHDFSSGYSDDDDSEESDDDPEPQSAGPATECDSWEDDFVEASESDAPSIPSALSSYAKSNPTLQLSKPVIQRRQISESAVTNMSVEENPHSTSIQYLPSGLHLPTSASSDNKMQDGISNPGLEQKSSIPPHSQPISHSTHASHASISIDPYITQWLETPTVMSSNQQSTHTDSQPTTLQLTIRQPTAAGSQHHLRSMTLKSKLPLDPTLCIRSLLSHRSTPQASVVYLRSPASNMPVSTPVSASH